MEAPLPTSVSWKDKIIDVKVPLKWKYSHMYKIICWRKWFFLSFANNPEENSMQLKYLNKKACLVYYLQKSQEIAHLKKDRIKVKVSLHLGKNE